MKRRPLLIRVKWPFWPLLRCSLNGGCAKFNIKVFEEMRAYSNFKMSVADKRRWHLRSNVLRMVMKKSCIAYSKNKSQGKVPIPLRRFASCSITIHKTLKFSLLALNSLITMLFVLIHQKFKTENIRARYFEHIPSSVRIERPQFNFHNKQKSQFR